MADQAAAGTVQGPGGSAAQPVAAVEPHSEHVNGSTISWIGVGITCIGFVIGGGAFWDHVHWLAFWAGTGVAVVGLIIMLFAKTFNEDWY